MLKVKNVILVMVIFVSLLSIMGASSYDDTTTQVVEKSNIMLEVYESIEKDNSSRVSSLTNVGIALLFLIMALVGLFYLHNEEKDYS